MSNMKKIVAWLLAVVMVVGCFQNLKGTTVNAAGETKKLVFDANADYSESNGNPNGQWTYQSYRVTPTFGNFEKATSGDFTYWGNANSYIDNNREGHEGYLMFRLGNNVDYGAAVTFKAPYTGTIKIEMKNNHIAFNTSEPKVIDIIKNSKDKMDLTNVIGSASNSVYPFTAITEYQVTEGDTISFACNNQSGSATSLVYMNPIITYTAIDGLKTLYDANIDYSESNGNPNGQWTYQSYRVTPTFGTFSKETSGNYTYWGNSSCYVDNNRENYDGYLMFRLANGTDYGSAVTFTAPYTGKLRIQMRNDCIAYSSNAPKVIDIVKNLTQKMDLTNVIGSASNNKYPFTTITNYEVTKGDTISFACNNNGGAGTSLVYMDPIISYSEIVVETALGFPSDASIAVTDITTEGMTMTWPEATGGTGNYSYSVYTSETAISDVPSTGGKTASGTTYTWTGLTYGKSYYVAVVVSDGENTELLATAEPTTIIPEDYIYNASKQYALDKGNPNGQWTYQSYTPNAATKLNTMSVYQNKWWGSDVVYIQNNADTGYQDMMRMVPQTTQKGAAVSFTAPYSGTIEISMNDGCVKSHTYNNHRSTFSVLRNGEVMQGYPVNLGDGSTSGSNVHTFTPFTLSIQKGEVISFAILRQLDGTAGTSYISPVIRYTGLGMTFYIDGAEGNDANAGTSESEAWKTFDNLQNGQLNAGDKVLIKKGTTITDQLVLNKAQGTEEKPVVIGTYGDAEAKPVLQYIVEENEETLFLESMAAPVVQLIDCHGIEIDGLEIAGTSGVDVGLHLKYNNTFNNEYVKIKNCDFKDLTGFTIEDYRGQSDRAQNENITGDYCMATGICVSVNNYNIGVNDPGLIGLYIEGCTTNNCGTLLANAGNIHDTNEGNSPLISGLYISNCTMTNNDYYGAYIGSVQNGYMTNCLIDHCGDATDFAPGTAGILVSAKNFDIINTEITEQQRGGQDYDGVGIDFEKSNDDVTVQNCYIHNNTGSAIFFYDSNDGSDSANQNCSVKNNVFVNNASAAKGTLSIFNGHDDPIADIRITSGKGYALKNSTIIGNKYFNNNDYSLLSGRYSFSSQNESDTTMQSTVSISSNEQLTSIEGLNGFIDDKTSVLATVQESHKDDIHTSYTFDRTPLSNAELGFTLLTTGDVYRHSTDFSNIMTGVWKYRHYQDGVWTDLQYDSAGSRWINSVYDEEADSTAQGGAMILKDYMHPHTSGQTVLEFVPTITGKVHITLEETTISYKSDDGTYITILNQDLEPISAPIYLKDASNTSMTRKSYDLGYVVVNEGEPVYFCLSKCENSQNDTTFIDPKIEYQVTGGSVNEEEGIDVTDLVALKKLAKKAEYHTNADYNADTKVNATDTTFLRRYLVGYWD